MNRKTSNTPVNRSKLGNLYRSEASSTLGCSKYFTRQNAFLTELLTYGMFIA